MKSYALIAGTSAILLAACGAEKKGGTNDSTAAAPPQTPAAATAGQVATPDNGTAPAPITGQTVEVKMLQDSEGHYRYDPADVTIKSGDGVKFVMVSGGTHNVAFDPAQIPA